MGEVLNEPGDFSPTIRDQLLTLVTEYSSTLQLEISLYYDIGLHLVNRRVIFQREIMWYLLMCTMTLKTFPVSFSPSVRKIHPQWFHIWPMWHDVSTKKKKWYFQVLFETRSKKVRTHAISSKRNSMENTNTYCLCGDFADCSKCSTSAPTLPEI